MDYTTLKLSVIYQPKGRAAEYAPLACNLYMGCEHGCKYCYVPAVIKKTPAEFWSAPFPRSMAIFPKIEKDLQKLIASGVRSPVLFSFSSDPYQPAEEYIGHTRNALGIFQRYDYPACILSKGGMRSLRDLSLLAAGSQVAASLTFDNDADSLKWEPKAAMPQERIDALAEAHSQGFFTWASLEPVIDPAQTLELIRRSAHAVDHYKVGTWNHAAGAKAIDYASFLSEAEALIRSLGKTYLIKDDLEKFRAA